MEEIKKENGDALNDKTEQGMEKEAQGEQKGLTGLGKFKDVNALLQAYTALEAEFTRRSQRLKALEKVTENDRVKPEPSPEENASAEVETGSAENCASSDEKTPAPVQRIECTPNETEVCKPDTHAENSAANKEEGSFSPAFSSVRNTEYQFADDELYSAVLANEAVRLKVIGEYLNSIGKNGAPIVKGGTGTLAVQPTKADTIHSAGAMALRMFKNATKQA